MMKPSTVPIRPSSTRLLAMCLTGAIRVASFELEGGGEVAAPGIGRQRLDEMAADPRVAPGQCCRAPR
ncbi:MAG: hypothetical protein R3D25_05110 [Geminicoccaceae bacterium]